MSDEGFSVRKKIALVGISLLMLSLPLIASAQTTAFNEASLIATLTQLIQVLEQELQQLIAARSSTPQTQTPVSVFPPAPSQCAAFAALKKGDTDATTGGQVSQLQAFLGISPATGYYGAKTSIGYQNKCGNLGNAEPSSVPGMSRYTDPDFGFSFWYPSGWNVTTIPYSDQIFGGQTIRTFVVKNSNPDETIYINEVRTDAQVKIPGHFASITYFFDPPSHAWMEFTSDDTTPRIADVSTNTMGGLHMLSTAQTFDPSVVPLSVHNFLVFGLSGGDNASCTYTCPLVRTVLALDPSVAIPVSTAQQIATIQAEASAYGANSQATGLSASPTSGPAPLTVTFLAPPSAGGDFVDFGDGTNSCTNPNAEDCGGDVGSDKPFTHTFTKPGTYAVTVSRRLPAIIIGTATITATGSSQ